MVTPAILNGFTISIFEIVVIGLAFGLEGATQCDTATAIQFLRRVRDIRTRQLLFVDVACVVITCFRTARAAVGDFIAPSTRDATNNLSALVTTVEFNPRYRPSRAAPTCLPLVKCDGIIKCLKLKIRY